MRRPRDVHRGVAPATGPRLRGPAAARTHPPEDGHAPTPGDRRPARPRRFGPAALAGGSSAPGSVGTGPSHRGPAPGAGDGARLRGRTADERPTATTVAREAQAVADRTGAGGATTTDLASEDPAGRGPAAGPFAHRPRSHPPTHTETTAVLVLAPSPNARP